MDFVIAFNLANSLAWWSGTIFGLISLGCIGYMFLLREVSARRCELRRNVSEKWEEPLFTASIGDEGAKLKGGQEVYVLTAEDKKDVLRTYIEKGRFDPVEPLRPTEVPDFLFLWNYLHESLRGVSKNNLNELAGDLKITPQTYRLLRGRSLRDKLIAINTLGNLRETEGYDELEKLTHHKDPIVSLWAWRALLRIDFDRTLKSHLQMIADRVDWSPTFVAKVLLEADPDELAGPLVELVAKNYDAGLAERQLARVISYLGIVHVREYSPLVNRIMTESNLTEVLISCLRLTRTADALPRVRDLLRHDRWEVRLQAVQTIGRLAHPEDAERLIECLNDLDWWVRYRAASALYLMPGMTPERLDELSHSLPNEFSRDILSQVIAENRLLCFKPTQPSFLSK